MGGREKGGLFTLTGSLTGGRMNPSPTFQGEGRKSGSDLNESGATISSGVGIVMSVGSSVGATTSVVGIVFSVGSSVGHAVGEGTIMGRVRKGGRTEGSMKMRGGVVDGGDDNEGAKVKVSGSMGEVVGVGTILYKE